MTNKSPARRKWLQFRLRTLLVAILMLSLPLSWFAVRLERVRRQRVAVEQVAKRGGELRCYYLDWDTQFRTTMVTPDWLQTLLGEELAHDACRAFSTYEVNCIECDLSGDEDFRFLPRLPTVRYVCLRNCRVTDNMVEYLKDLPRLEYLELSGTQVTSEDFRRVQKEIPHCRVSFPMIY